MSICCRGTPLKDLLHVALRRNGRRSGCNSLLHTPTLQHLIHPGVRQLSSRTVLHDLGEVGEGRSPVRVTLADNPSIIVCHHPPNKVLKRLTRPVSEEKVVLEEITSEQREVALTLLTDNPMMWDSSAIADMFNVSLDSVNGMQVPREVLEKQEISQAVLQSWSVADQKAFKSLMTVSRYEIRNKLLASSPHLFDFCHFDRAEELAKIKLYGMKSEFPDTRHISDS